MQARSQTRETKGAYPLSRAGVLFEISTSACFAMQKATFQINIRVSLFSKKNGLRFSSFTKLPGTKVVNYDSM